MVLPPSNLSRFRGERVVASPKCVLALPFTRYWGVQFDVLDQMVILAMND